MKENYVRKAELKDALELAPKIRKGDRQEIMASNGATPLEALVIPSKEKGYGVVWLLSSEDLFKHIKQFIKECPKWVNEMSKDYEYVYNFVDERNWKSLKWLQFLGFEPKTKIGDFGIGKMPFLLMMKEVNN